MLPSLNSLSMYNSKLPCPIHDKICINAISKNTVQAHCQCNQSRSFLLIDGKENLMVSNAEQFLEKLNCGQKDLRVKVVSIFGNTGDGKSHTLNQTFFNGDKVFKTSNDQNSCTLGVWAAFDPVLQVICLDTEGLLGVSAYENERTRLLLKVLAVSDVVVYRTQSEKLNTDLFKFLGAASRAYSHHFQTALQAVRQREGVLNSLSTMGPSIIVLHETRYTKPLTNSETKTAEDILRMRFVEMQLETEAFSSIKYVGLQAANLAADYQPLKDAITKELKNTTVRYARQPHLVYNTLRTLNDKFSDQIDHKNTNCLFPDQYFTCLVKCLSCGCRCTNSMGHLRQGVPHDSGTRCQYQDKYENLAYICKQCYDDGSEVRVTKRIESQNDSSWYGLVTHAWVGNVIECPHCGKIYRSRQYWFGNKDPEEEFAVRTEIIHVWDMGNYSLGSQITAQKVVDSMSYITGAVTNISLQPTKVLSAWVTDQVAPSYWRPNNEIKHCHKCNKLFGPADSKHHCRACGEGFCSGCSSNKKCVPFRNWHTPVRVCDNCYDKDNDSNEITKTSEDVNARKVTEQVFSTLSAVGSVLNYSKSLIKDSVRPLYWIPDSEAVSCCVCDAKFSVSLTLHHCRDCGRGVCQDCSQNRNPVPHRGWKEPVRVCDTCKKIN